MSEKEPVKLVPTKPDAEIAADLKRRVEEAMIPVLAIFDEALQSGLAIRWDALAPLPPLFRNHKITGLRIIKEY